MNTDTGAFYDGIKSKGAVAVYKSKDKFNVINAAGGPLDWTTEENFALQILSANDYIAKIAESNPQSVYRAVTNLAAIGLTLNPAMGFAYLVPREGKICLDISYKGLAKIATDSGSVRWVQARIVYAEDIFRLNGINEAPSHEVGSKNHFDTMRGEIAGVYCVVRTSDGDFLTDVMSKEEVDVIMKRSSLVKSGKSSPWLTDWEEMAKKTVVKRASKLWPKTDRENRLDAAISAINEHDGIDFEKESAPKEPVVVITESQAVDLISMLQEKSIKTEKVLKFYKINKLGDLPADKWSECLSLIEKTSANEKK